MFDASTIAVARLQCFYSCVYDSLCIFFGAHAYEHETAVRFSAKRAARQWAATASRKQHARSARNFRAKILGRFPDDRVQCCLGPAMFLYGSTRDFLGSITPQNLHHALGVRIEVRITFACEIAALYFRKGAVLFIRARCSSSEASCVVSAAYATLCDRCA